MFIVQEWFSVFWTFILICTALLFSNPDGPLLIIGLKIASFTYGSLLSLFLLSKFSKKIDNTSIVIGYLSGILTVFYFIRLDIAWTYYILGSVIINISVVMLLKTLSTLLSNEWEGYIYIVKSTISLLVLALAFFTCSYKMIKKKRSFTLISLIIKLKIYVIKIVCGMDMIFLSYIIKKINNVLNVGIVVNHTK